MKKALFIIIFLTFLASCGNTNTTENMNSTNNNSGSTTATSNSGSETQTSRPNNGGRMDMKSSKLVDTELQTMIAEVEPKFQTLEFSDPETGKTLTYNLFVPENYNPNKKYPLVLFMGDASTTGSGEEYTLTQGWGGLVWATEANQAKEEVFVLVPYFTGENGAAVNDQWQVSEEAELTIPLLKNIVKQYSIDENRLYTTGQSGGGMLSFYFNIKYPDLFAASLFVGSQGNPDELEQFKNKKFFYIVSENDPKASKGMASMKSIFENTQANFAQEIISAQLPQDEKTQLVQKMMNNNNIGMILFEKGTTLLEGQTASGGAGEHMTSFDWAYKIDAVREWLLSQKK